MTLLALPPQQGNPVAHKRFDCNVSPRRSVDPTCTSWNSPPAGRHLTCTSVNNLTCTSWNSPTGLPNCCRCAT